ncbi:aminoglycoside phosphotransferase family protein [Kribbella sp. NPDC051952]|uniref:aminoglycoside phosphotransferase family protein n=1 Tax=Kribbella sp. NPDC051952 TaxID=3154851 RepID=UPI00342CFA34
MSHQALWSEVRPPSTADVSAAFGVDVGELQRHPGGFEADAFTDGRWFVKLWREQPDSDAALALTAELATRGIPVPAAQQALDGSYTSEHLGRRYALFPYVEGRQATWDDIDEMARAMRAVHEITDLDLPRAPINEWCIEALRDQHGHPWIADRSEEILANVDRLEAVIEQARASDVPNVVCHRDLFPHNVLIDRTGSVTALLDWGHTTLAPREHDLFTALCGPDPVRFLTAYKAEGLNSIHLEYARLARSLRDLAVRVCNQVDQDGINTWGIEGLRRVDADLAQARPFCNP